MPRHIMLLPLLAFLTGCPVTQRLDTPVQPFRAVEPRTGVEYWVYVPSYHSKNRTWPLVITLHGTFGWDGPQRQLMEWQWLAEERGLIVAAPALKSVQGITPVVRSLWYDDLARDERVILSLIDELTEKYRLDGDPRAILLTGFSAGGYPMYYAGLRNPGKFGMLAARACNSSIDIFEKIPPTAEARRMPIFLFWGKDDLPELQRQSWQAFRYLREHGFAHTQKKEVSGGHLRRPEVAYEAWRAILPEHLRHSPED